MWNINKNVEVLYHPLIPMRFPNNFHRWQIDSAQQCPKSPSPRGGGGGLSHTAQTRYHKISQGQGQNDIWNGDATNARMAGCDMMSAWLSAINAWPNTTGGGDANKCKYDNECQTGCGGCERWTLNVAVQRMRNGQQRMREMRQMWTGGCNKCGLDGVQQMQVECATNATTPGCNKC